jgi:Transposase
MAEARRARLSTSRSYSLLLAAIAARRCGATSWRSEVNTTVTDSRADARQSTVVAEGPAARMASANKPARMSWPSAAAAASADREHQHARTESYNRLVKTVKRTGYGFRNRENSACRIFQCTRKRRPEPRPQPDCPVKIEEPE